MSFNKKNEDVPLQCNVHAYITTLQRNLTQRTVHSLLSRSVRGHAARECLRKEHRKSVAKIVRMAVALSARKTHATR